LSSWHTEETYKSLIQLSVGGLRFGALVNGGAAIALLALVGDLYGKGVQLAALQAPMICFIVGIVLAGLAHFTAYLTQLALYEESADRRTGSGIYQHRTFLYLSFLLVIGSLGLFCWGAYAATAIITGGGSAN